MVSAELRRGYKKQSVDYTLAKVKLSQSWRYKTLVVIKPLIFIFLLKPQALKHRINANTKQLVCELFSF